MYKKAGRSWGSLLAILIIDIAMIAAVIATLNGASAHTEPVHSPQPESATNEVEREIPVIVDDFVPDLLESDSFYVYNRLDGNRGVLNNSLVDLGGGRLTTTIALNETWGGLWMSLNHPVAEEPTIDFSAVLPPQISSPYQSRITGIRANVVTGTKDTTFRLELKDSKGVLQWNKQITLTGGPQVVTATLPSLGHIKEFLWVQDNASAGDYVVVDSVSLTATTRITDTATAAFVWSYGMLLNNWDPDTGLVRDKARHESGEFDAIQATGSLAAATAVAAQLGVIEWDSARQIVNSISDTLLIDTPRFHGLWPHFVNVSPTGTITIAPGTEWSSVDTAIAAIGLLDAQSGLGMDTAGAKNMLESIDWPDLVSSNGITHGYTYTGAYIPNAWDIFGGESWLVELAYASAVSHATWLSYPTPPTSNGSGFIDELAWLFVLPPSGLDYWGNDWEEYRIAATFTQTHYYSTTYPGGCFDQLGIFGLSAAEVPPPWIVPDGESVYQAFGVGGRSAPPNDRGFRQDWTPLLEAPVVTPHYSAMIAALRPQEAIGMWTWLINETPFSPLNNVESLMFPAGSSCDPEDVEWNHLKGSWNLALQTLGWGNYLTQREGQNPVTWRATLQNAFIRHGYSILVPNGIKETYLPVINRR